MNEGIKRAVETCSGREQNVLYSGEISSGVLKRKKIVVITERLISVFDGRGEIEILGCSLISVTKLDINGDKINLQFLKGDPKRLKRGEIEFGTTDYYRVFSILAF